MDQRFEKFCKRIGVSTVDWLFPPVCAGCDSEGTWLCDTCRTVARSGGIQRIVVGKQKCVVTSLTTYAVAPIKTALWRFKYQSVRAYGGVFTDALIDILPKHYYNSRVLVPIPLSPWRLRWRGYNQADVFARACALRRGVNVCAGLVRVRATRPQVTTKDKSQRAENVKGVFALGPHASELRGKKVLIVDDVVTTGATLAEAAKVLRKAHPATIEALTIARDA